MVSNDIAEKLKQLEIKNREQENRILQNISLKEELERRTKDCEASENKSERLQRETELIASNLADLRHQLVANDKAYTQRLAEVAIGTTTNTPIIIFLL